jgi:hypothetical protein
MRVQRRLNRCSNSNISFIKDGDYKKLVISAKKDNMTNRTRGGARIGTVELHHPLLPLDIIDSIKYSESFFR